MHVLQMLRLITMSYAGSIKRNCGYALVYLLNSCIYVYSSRRILGFFRYLIQSLPDEKLVKIGLPIRHDSALKVERLGIGGVQKAKPITERGAPRIGIAS